MREPRVVRGGGGPLKPVALLGVDGDLVELSGRGSNRDQLPVHLDPLLDVLQRIADTLDDLLIATKDITAR